MLVWIAVIGICFVQTFILSAMLNRAALGFYSKRGSEVWERVCRLQTPSWFEGLREAGVTAETVPLLDYEVTEEDSAFGSLSSATEASPPAFGKGSTDTSISIETETRTASDMTRHPWHAVIGSVWMLRTRRRFGDRLCQCILLGAVLSLSLATHTIGLTPATACHSWLSGCSDSNTVLVAGLGPWLPSYCWSKDCVDERIKWYATHR